MKTDEHIRLAGIGAHTRSHHSGFTKDETLGLIEAWCINPELYQDIKNELRNTFQKNRGFFRNNIFVSQFKVHDSHMVLVVDVYRARYREDSDRRIHSFLSGQLCMSLNEDGLITDIVPRPKMMNPHNGRPVGPRIPLK